MACVQCGGYLCGRWGRSLGTDDLNYAVEIGADGKGTVDIENLPFGEYDIAAKFLENDNYKEAVYDGTAKVVVNSNAAIFDIAIKNITYGEGLVVIVENATDAAGNPLSGMVMGEIKNAAGEGAGLIVYVTDGRGTRTYTGLNAGDYVVSATFVDDNWKLFSDTVELNVNVAQAEPTVGATYANGEIAITLDGSNGEKLNETVTVAIDGTPIDLAAATQNGTFTFAPNLAPGAHIIEVGFAGNDNYLAGSASTSFEVPKATPAITVTGSEVDFGQDATVTLTVKDGETPVAGYAVVTVNGVNYAVEIGADGTGTLTIAGLAANEYPIAAKFLANDKYEEAVYSGDAKVVVGPSKELTIEVTANEPAVGQDTIITVTATDGSGAAVPVDKVNVTIDGVTTEYPVAADGTVNIGALPAGETPVTVSVDDGVHTPASKDITAVVSTPTVLGTDITVTVTNITYGDAEVITFTLADSNGEKLTGNFNLNVTVGDQVKEVDQQARPSYHRSPRSLPRPCSRSTPHPTPRCGQQRPCCSLQICPITKNQLCHH